MHHADFIIIGGGIVGLATAWELSNRFDSMSITLIEKESAPAMHQTGRNSGVLHSGIYYRPGSLKARNCSRGKKRLEQFCDQYRIPYEICGKVIVATHQSQLPAIERVCQNGLANDVACRLIEPEALHELEPHANGIKAIHVPGTGIIDFKLVCHKLVELLTGAGHRIELNTLAVGINQRDRRVVVETTRGEFSAGKVINCAGLYSDRITRMSGMKSPVRLVPFRGEYYKLREDSRQLCRHLIYPVPDPRFPFLGVHFTRMIHGGVECGPNAVLAFAREGYSWSDVNLKELFDTLCYPGFIRMAGRHCRTGLMEMWRSLSKAAFVRALQQLVPDIQAGDLIRADAGVRAQAVCPDGGLLDDFFIQKQGNIINICNAPSPAATASLNIAKIIADQI